MKKHNDHNMKHFSVKASAFWRQCDSYGRQPEIIITGFLEDRTS
jgi:hypothetical protein